ncbi:hypothetical protein JW962_02270 [Candidatus Dojkabacteria bacterium]|nr:hypothetical protein [Candidatus Dojkabacteria bacterium]
METVQEPKENKKFSFQKIKEFFVANYLVILVVLAFVGLLIATYFVYFKDLLNPAQQGDESLGELSIDDPNGGLNLSNTAVYLDANAEITQWPELNKVYELVDINIMLDLISAMQSLGFVETKSEYFTTWAGNKGNATLYTQILKISLTNSGLVINSSGGDVNSSVAKALNDLFQTEYFDNYTFSVKNVAGYESIIGTLSVNKYKVLNTNFEEDLIELVVDSDGQITYMSMLRYLPDFNKVGTYNGYNSDGIVDSFKSGTAGSKIVKTQIVFDEYNSVYDDPITEEDPNYATGIVFSDINFQNLNISAMGQVYYLDMDNGYLLPVIVIQGKATISSMPGLSGGLYTMEFWHTNVR